MLDWNVFTSLAADNTSGTITLSADSLTLFILLLEFAGLENWTVGGDVPGVLVTEAIEGMVAQAWNELT